MRYLIWCCNVSQETTPKERCGLLSSKTARTGAGTEPRPEKPQPLNIFEQNDRYSNANLFGEPTTDTDPRAESFYPFLNQR